jgi:hypothetical protein
MSRTRNLWMLSGLCVLGMVRSGLQGAELHVDGATTSIAEFRALVADVNEADVLIIDSAPAGGRYTLGGTEIVIARDLTIDASGVPGGLTFDGEELSRVFQIINATSVSLKRIEIINGKSAADGGGIYTINSLANLSLIECRVIGNRAIRNGGGIYSRGRMILDDCTLSGNGAEMDGAGIYNLTGMLELRNCTLSGNSADGWSSDAGGVYNQRGELTMSNCTVVGNTASIAAGGLRNHEGVMILSHCTVVGNRATYPGGGTRGGGGVYNRVGSLSLSNCVIAENKGMRGADIYYGTGTVVVSGVNLIGDNSTVEEIFPFSLPLVGKKRNLAKPHLAPLGSNGGLTETMHPLPGSAVIDGGVLLEGASLADQRGYSRPYGLQPDIGAVEYGVMIPSIGFPASGEEGVSMRPLFVWTFEPFADHYEVHLGTDSGELEFAASTPVGVYAPGDLEPDTTYFWRVDAVIGLDLVEGIERSFRTRRVLLVDTIVDEDDGVTVNGVSLRDAVSEAVITPGYDFIRFNAALNGQRIILTEGDIFVDTRLSEGSDFSIEASPLNGGLTIEAAVGSRIFGFFGTNSVLLDSLDLVGGRPPSSGGAIIQEVGELTVRNCVIRDSVASSAGGGIVSYYGCVILIDCELSGNRADGSSGGAIYSTLGFLSLENCVLAGNSCVGEGGGVYAHYGEVSLRNCTHSRQFSAVSR